MPCVSYPVVIESPVRCDMTMWQLSLAMVAGAAQAQVGNLIWEDEFTDLENWIVQTGNGSWGWGNGELECYLEDNVDIAEIPGEPGNTALRITARQETGPHILECCGGTVIKLEEATIALVDR